MSRPASLASRLVHAGYVQAYSHRCRPADTLPIGTYVTKMSESRRNFCTEALHAIGLCREDVDDQSLVLRFPPFILRMRVNDRLDILLNVSFLPALVVQGNREES